jgi:hypothetical protein
LSQYGQLIPLQLLEFWDMDKPMFGMDEQNCGV